MKTRTNLDLDALRTFVLGFDLGSFARAAQRVGRSQSAISTQLRRLEDQVGQPLVRKAGRGLAPTEAGESLLSYARRILDLNDEAVSSLREAGLEGCVRLGLPQDFAEAWLPEMLGRFVQAHPRVRVEVQAEKVRTLVAKTVRGELDMSLAWGKSIDAPHVEHIADIPIIWVGRADWPGRVALGGEAFPLIAFEAPCAFREPAVAALDQAGIIWRLAFSSPSLSGLWAAAAAGLGVTVRTRIGIPPGLIALDPTKVGMPDLPSASLTLVRAASKQERAVDVLTDILRTVVQEKLAAI